MGVEWISGIKTTVEQIPKLNVNSVKLYEEQVDKINKETGHTVIWIIPTDQANEALRIKVAKNEFRGVDKQSQLFRDPIGHPGPVLQALNSYVHFATIYGVSSGGSSRCRRFSRTPKTRNGMMISTSDYRKSLGMRWSIIHTAV